MQHIHTHCAAPCRLPAPGNGHFEAALRRSVRIILRHFAGLTEGVRPAMLSTTATPRVMGGPRMDARFLAYLAVAAVLIVTPGPDMALVARNAVRGGARAARASAWGVG